MDEKFLDINVKVALFVTWFVMIKIQFTLYKDHPGICDDSTRSVFSIQIFLPPVLDDHPMSQTTLPFHLGGLYRWIQLYFMMMSFSQYTYDVMVMSLSQYVTSQRFKKGDDMNQCCGLSIYYCGGWMNCGIPSLAVCYVNWYWLIDQIVLRHKWVRYLHQTSIIVFTILYAIKSTRFHLSSGIVANVSY